jgi:hypothetical protein
MNRSTTTARTPASIVCSALLPALLAGCAGYAPGDLKPGTPEAALRERMGAPTDRVALPGGGQRLEYARGPYGAHTYRVELDGAGRVTGWRQLLTESAFDALPVGAPSAEVRDRLGRPSQVRVGWRGVGEVWSYRYEWLNLCRWFQVWLVDGRVREAGYATDPLCDEKRPFIGEQD